MVWALNKIRKMSVRNGHLILKLYYKKNVFDSQVILHRCLCEIIDGKKNAEMTKINGVVITESPLFDLNLIFLSMWHRSLRQLDNRGKERALETEVWIVDTPSRTACPPCALVLTYDTDIKGKSYGSNKIRCKIFDQLQDAPHLIIFRSHEICNKKKISAPHTRQ